jgi:hypothetical protein
VTSPDAPLGITGVTEARREVGSWDSTGHAHATPLDVRAFDGNVQVLIGARPVRWLELALGSGAGAAFFRASGVSQDNYGVLDTVARARFDLASHRWMDRVLPATWLTVRAPTGNAPNATAGGTAAPIGAFGLGAWEFALGGEVRLTALSRWEPYVAVEGALRAPDNTFDVPRQLGPRVSARGGLAYAIAPTLSLGMLVEWNWEGAPALRGQPIANGWEHRTSVGLLLVSTSNEGVRTSLAVASDLPIDGLGRNAEATFRLLFSVNFAGPRREHMCPPCESHHHSEVAMSVAGSTRSMVGWQ